MPAQAYDIPARTIRPAPTHARMALPGRGEQQGVRLRRHPVPRAAPGELQRLLCWRRWRRAQHRVRVDAAHAERAGARRGALGQHGAFLQMAWPYVSIPQGSFFLTPFTSMATFWHCNVSLLAGIST